jgi:hypothetical protein
MRPKRPASQWPHIVCLTLSCTPSSAPLARSSACASHTRTQADTGHCASLHVPPDDTHKKAPKHAIMPSPPQILPQICPSIPLKRWPGASRAQSMHAVTCSTLGRLAASQPAPTDALAGFSEHVSREHVTSAEHLRRIVVPVAHLVERRHEDACAGREHDLVVAGRAPAALLVHQLRNQIGASWQRAARRHTVCASCAPPRRLPSALALPRDRRATAYTRAPSGTGRTRRSGM